MKEVDDGKDESADTIGRKMGVWGRVRAEHVTCEVGQAL
jgi:hypothetical protein